MEQTIERNTLDRRHASGLQLDSLIKSRRAMWADFCELADLRPYRSGPELDARVHQFCQYLIDYTATAHFHLYHRLAEGKENRSNMAAVAETLYPTIARSTDVILTFNDVFGEGYDIVGSDLEEGLSELGETLAKRIELEDRILEASRYDRRKVEH